MKAKILVDFQIYINVPLIVSLQKQIVSLQKQLLLIKTETFTIGVF